jgi:Protein of unknown function (DUF3738)
MARAGEPRVGPGTIPLCSSLTPVRRRCPPAATGDRGAKDVDASLTSSDRFHLAIHRATKTLAVYVITVAKGKAGHAAKTKIARTNSTEAAPSFHSGRDRGRTLRSEKRLSIPRRPPSVNAPVAATAQSACKAIDAMPHPSGSALRMRRVKSASIVTLRVRSATGIMVHSRFGEGSGRHHQFCSGGCTTSRNSSRVVMPSSAT